MSAVMEDRSLRSVVVLYPCEERPEPYYHHARALVGAEGQIHLVAHEEVQTHLFGEMRAWIVHGSAAVMGEYALEQLEDEPGVTTRRVSVQQLTMLAQELVADRPDAVLIAPGDRSHALSSVVRVLQSSRLMVGWIDKSSETTLRRVGVLSGSSEESLLELLRTLRPWLSDCELLHVVRTGGIEARDEELSELISTAIGGSYVISISSVSLPFFFKERVVAERMRSLGVDLIAVEATQLLGLGVGEMGEDSASLPLVVGVPLSPGHREGAPVQTSDIVWTGAAVEVVVERSTLWGEGVPVKEGALTLFRDGVPSTESRVDEGFAWFDALEEDQHYGLAPAGEGEDVGALGTDSLLHVVSPSGDRVTLVDASHLEEVLPVNPTPGRRWWVVRLGSTSLSLLRKKLRHTDAHVLLDARQVLGEGDLDKLPEVSRRTRLSRVAHRLRALGVPVDRVVGGAHASGFAVLSPEEVKQGVFAREEDELEACWKPVGSRWEESVGAVQSTASAFEVQMDNHEARNALLSSIASAEREITLQIYMFEEDDFGHVMARALSDAASRGVTVRVMVDALWSMYQAVGQERLLLKELSEVEGLLLLPIHPLAGLPDYEGLKRRDHRKLIVIDGALAFVCGRNFGTHYYTGFHEHPITKETPFRALPWLDANLRLEGEIVGLVEQSLRRTWVQAGGATWTLHPVAPPGAISVKWVEHRGVQDAHTLELYRTLIDGAKTRIFAANTFPLYSELRKALLRALRRGVEVTWLVGNVRPVYGPDRTAFPVGEEGSQGQAKGSDVVNQVIHGRLDALVAEGAVVWEYGVRGENIAEDLGTVFPHVHAKMLLVDGEKAAIGSANFDLTSSYWESEAVVVVEDTEKIRVLEEEIGHLLHYSERFDRDPDHWKEVASNRAWIARNWPGLMS